MEREACVCDHGYERSDLCAEIIIIIIIILIITLYLYTVFGSPQYQSQHHDHYLLGLLLYSPCSTHNSTAFTSKQYM